MRFEELDWQQTDLGELTLRRRAEPTLGIDVFEVKLGDEYLMSSLFTVAEEQLATLGLAAAKGDSLAVMVGGLGLGYTAVTALDDDRVASLTVVEKLAPVIDWHERGLLPESSKLTDDLRTTLLLADFFELMRTAPQPDAGRCDAILLDIDHSPRHQLNPNHADLYSSSGLDTLAEHLAPHGVFALWSDDLPDDEFFATLEAVFDDCAAHIVSFDNHLTGGQSANSVYVARKRA